MKRWAGRLLWVKWIAVVILVLATHFFGQCWWPTAAMVYAPTQMWIFFLGLIAIPAWWVSRQLVWCCLGTMLVFAGPLWQWRAWRPEASLEVMRDPKTIRVLTANRGDHHGHDITAFVNRRHPDLIAMQDATYHNAFHPDAPEYADLPNKSRVGEFQLLSRFPITKTQLLMTKLQPRPQHPAVKFQAARFEIDFHGQAVAVYDVHMPSPREQFHRFFRYPSTANIESMKLFWRDHQTLIEDFTARMEAETMPVITLGDWNQPPVGPYYRRLIRQLQDAHTQAGKGYGWSFPGDWWTPFTAGQIWLRLDLVLCSRQWQVLRSEVESESASQHCAVSAILHLR